MSATAPNAARNAAGRAVWCRTDLPPSGSNEARPTRHGTRSRMRALTESLLVLALGEEGAHFGAEPVRCFDGTDMANARQDDQS